ncbi:trhZ, partial [Acinetobacter baumannii]|nr:trhZ [Acinetobacter baumannii]
TNSPPVVVTSALPGEYPLGVNIDEARDKVVVDLRPVMSQPVILQ